MKTLQERINEKVSILKANSEKELDKKTREINIEEIIKDLTGIEFHVLIHQWGKFENLSIWVDNDQYHPANFDRKQIGKYYQQICSFLSPVDTVIKTSSGETKTFAPAKIYFENNTSDIVWNHEQTAKISFSFDGGTDYKEITVSFKFPAKTGFSGDILGVSMFTRKQPFGRNTQKKMYYLDMFDKIKMYGNAFYAYCGNESERNDFMSVCFCGHTEEFADRYINGNIS